MRKALDQTSWEAASDLVAAWTASGKVGVVRVDVPPITDAVDKFFDDAKARQLQPATIGKQTNLLKNRLLPWCADKGLRLLKQLGVDALREFRATWDVGGRPAVGVQESRTPPVVHRVLPASRLDFAESGESS